VSGHAATSAAGGIGAAQLRHPAGGDAASILMTNAPASNASCILTCKFSKTRYHNDLRVTGAKPIPAGREVEFDR
jgi:hypothetical protein